MAYDTLTGLLKGIADSIRSKKGTTAAINAQNLPSEISSIVKATGSATASQVLSGVTFSNSSGGSTGTMTNNGAVSKSISPGDSYTVPAGYHNGSGTVSAAANTGTAETSHVLEGKTFYGSGATKQTGVMPNNGTISKSISPGGSYTVPKGYHSGSGTVSANMPSGNAGTGDVLSGKTFSNSSTNGATGTMTNRGAWSTSISPGGSVTIPAGYHNGGGSVSAGSGGHFVYKNGGLGQWDSATLDFGAPCSAGYAQVTFHVDGYNNASRQDHYIEASNDNSSWIRIAYLGSNPRDRDGAGRIHGSVSGYRFVRIRCECGNVNFRVHGYMIAGIVA